MAQGEEQIAEIQGVNSSTDTWTTGYNATLALQSAADTVPTFVPIVVITAIGAVLIGIVAMFGRRG